MNMVTTCPSCLTNFIIKPEQLESHQGQVRCSQCQHVFMAKEHLNDPTKVAEFLSPTPINPKNKKLATLTITLLITSAIFQSLFFVRADIANHWPVSKPFLTQICDFLQCNIDLPKHAELIAIDDTDLVKDEQHQNIIKFNCLLTNNAQYTQAFPSIELTLTDLNDQPLLRRRIKPHEYLIAGQGKINAGFTAGDEMHIALNLKTEDLPVAGFRAFVIYE